MTAREAARLKRVRAMASEWPETAVEPYHEHFVFKVRKKTFAYFLDDHHGDGIVGLCCKSTLERQQDLILRDPARYLVPAYLGPSGWVTLRMDLKTVDWNAVLELLLSAYRLQAPKRLAEAIGGG
jgi:hypothetical protein